MSNVDVIGLFKQAALEVHGRELGALDAATEISTLGLDSVAVMEMTGCLEEQAEDPHPRRGARRGGNAGRARHADPAGHRRQGGPMISPR